MPAVGKTRAEYRARRAHQSALHGVVLDHHERFEGVYDDRYSARLGDWRPVVAKAFKSFLDCGILAHGFLRVVCKDCRDEILVPWSCKTRQLCPSCGSRRSEEFAALLSERVLEPVPWRHVVLTIPKALRGLFLRERRLLRELSRCAWKTLQQGLETSLDHRDALGGAIVSVSTAGDLVNPHPHLHCIVSAGAWIGDSFVPWPEALTGERLEALFRRHVLKMLVRQERLEQDTADRLLRWDRSGFSVFVGEPIAPHAAESLLRLSRYLVKPPVSLQRLSYDQTTCTVTYSSHKRGETRSIAALDFLSLLSVHVPDPGEQTTRYYGRCSNVSRGRRRKSAGPDASPTPAAPPLPEPPSRKTFRLAWAALLSRVWGVEILRCSRCGGERRILAAITNLVTARRILSHLGLHHLPRPPDRHLCEDRDPTIKARYPLLYPNEDSTPPWEDEQGHSEQPEVTDPDAREDAVDSDPGWPVDAPFAED